MHYLCTVKKQKNEMKLQIKRHLTALTACLALMGCHHDHEHAHEHEGHDHAEELAESGHEGHHHGSDVIVLAPEKAAAAGIEIEEVQPGVMHGVIHTSGKVMAASCDETTVVATISGRVSQTGHVSEGMKLASGATLYTITSAGMQAADGDPVRRAKIALDKAQSDFERAEALVESQIVSRKDYEALRAEYEAARLTYDALSANRNGGGTIIRAPKGGFVKQNLVVDGDYVEAGQPMMIITQNQHLYLRAEVAERYFSELHRISGARFRTSYSTTLYDITDMGGHIQSYGRTAETGSAFIPVTFEFNNTGDVLQGSFADVYLITSPREGVLSLPITALTEEQGLHFVYVQTDDDEYRKQEVTLGMCDGERQEILTGLKGGERVVTRGAVQVRLASASNAIPAHTHNH